METTTRAGGAAQALAPVRDLQEQRQRRAARRMAMQMIALRFGYVDVFSWCRSR